MILAHPTKCILVVDDEVTIRELITEALLEAGYEVETAANGTAALERLSRRLPDAIVLDLMMPSLDGMGLTDLMRLNPRYAGVPVLLVTAAYGAEEAAKRIGVQAYITKPFELDHLVEVVRTLAGPSVARVALEGAPGVTLPAPSVDAIYLPGDSAAAESSSA